MTGEADLAVRVLVERRFAEQVGAVLMESLGPFSEEVEDPGSVALTFYPGPGEDTTDEGLLAPLPAGLRRVARVRLERRLVPRDWVDGWKDHFHPLVIGRIRVRPPWESPLPPAGSVEMVDQIIEVVINPGLGFGTGLHPTTRGTLALLQTDDGVRRTTTSGRGPLVDAGTGSGVLAVAAAKLGWAPVVAFDNDPWAVLSARENVAANDVGDRVRVCGTAVEDVPPTWFSGATVLANMTLEPVLALVRRFGPGACRPPERLVVSGILSGAQEEELVFEAGRCGLRPGRHLHEAEWATTELLPLGAG